MKFSYCLMNPPYGERGGTIHLRFVEKSIQIVNNQIVIMPFSLVTNLTTKRYIKYKDKLSQYINDIEEIDSKIFSDTNMDNLGIYSLTNNSCDITIKYIDGTIKKIKSLLDFKQFNEYEENFVSLIRNYKTQNFVWGGGHDRVTKKSLAKKGIVGYEAKKLIQDECERNMKNVPNDKVYLLLPCTNFRPDFIFSKFGNIYDNYEDLINYVKETESCDGYNIISFNTVNEAENCKACLQNYVLRFILSKVKDKRHMGDFYTKYFPAVDWTDDKVKTDEGLLELCGCTKDKIKEYAEYCKKMLKDNEV